MKLSILGCYSATPRKKTHTTSQLLEIKNHLLLIDCGEGTQVRLREMKIKFLKIEHIFISHLHGDHFYGLIGLISSFNLLGREKDLHIYAPKGIKNLINLHFELGNSWTNFKLIFHELVEEKTTVIFEDEKIIIKTIPLKHRIYTNGFLFKEKKELRKINKEAVKKYSLNFSDFKNLKNGEDFIMPDGIIIKNELLTIKPNPPKSYAFCSDTIYNEEIIPIIKKVDLLYHESTFLEEHINLAKKTFHSTAKQAAKIAQLAQVKHLLLGHYSTRYPQLESFKTEAKKEFKNVEKPYGYKGSLESYGTSSFCSKTASQLEGNSIGSFPSGFRNPNNNSAKTSSVIPNSAINAFVFLLIFVNIAERSKLITTIEGFLSLSIS